MSPPTFTSFPSFTTSEGSTSSRKKRPEHSDKRRTSAERRHELSTRHKKRHERSSDGNAEHRMNDVDAGLSAQAPVYDQVIDQSQSRYREGSGFIGSWTNDRDTGSGRCAEAGPSRSEWHFTDSIGEKDAHRYGTTTSLICPRYRRDENGRVLGLPGQLRSTRTGEKSAKGIEIAKLGQPYISRYADRMRQEEEHLRFRMDSAAFDPRAGFITVDLRQTGGTEPSSPSDYDTHDPVDVARERVQVFETHLKSHPEDTAAWIGYSRAHISTEDGALRSAQLDISLSILARALKGVSRTKSIPLHLEYMRVAAEVWPSARMEDAWSALLEKMEALITSGAEICDLWLGHFRWLEGSGFGRDGRDIETVMQLYKDRLAKLSEYTLDQVEREEKQLYLFVKACTFIAGAGYRERATAAFQAMLDVSLSIVDGSLTINQDFRGVLRDYEDFWDSGWLRLGEDGAEGWQYANKPSTHTSKPGSMIPPTHTKADAYQQWYIAERQAGLRTMPVRSLEAASLGSDPYEVVVFGDIRSLMFPIREPRGLHRLVAAFLRHQGVLIGSYDTPTSTAINHDPRLVSADAHASFWPPAPPHPERPWQTIAGEAMEPVRQSNLVNLTASPVRCWSVSRNTLLSLDWFSDFAPAVIGDSDVPMIRNIIRLCRDRLPDPFFDMISVALENAVSPKRAVKYTKEILAQEPENVTMWAGHALLESKRGKLQAARAVYVGVLAQHTDLPVGDGSPALAMWADWAMMEWKTRNQARCLEVLICLAHSCVPDGHLDATYQPQKPASLAMLKARKFYSNIRFPVALPWLTVSALFYYQDSCDSAIRLLQENASACGAGSVEREQTLQLLTEFYHRQSTWRPGPKAEFRQFLKNAIQEFPSNTQFLTAALWHQLQSGLRAPINDLIACLTEAEGALQSIVWSVWAEGISAIDLYAPGSGGDARVRATLRKALASHVGRDCPLLWLRAIEFERMMGRPEAAKTLLYRAMRQVGSCKELYMVPFHEDFRKNFTDAELTHIIEAMSIRGIRLRCEPINFAVSLEEGDVLPSDEELEDDELMFLRDTQANKPY